jgi:DNA-damage-inducible protein D
MENSNLLPFEGKEIRKAWHNEQWYFAVVDVIEVLTDSKDPKQYFEKIKKREGELDSYIRTNCTYVAFKGNSGKTRQYLSANTEGILRIVMSIPSPKAEPLKQWMAQVSTVHIQETENPELMTERQAEIYRAKGYSEDWIKERMQSIETRKRLTDEWKKRDVKEGQEYSILTATIAKGTFGLTPSEHKNHKKLTKPTQNLRDHMTPLELILMSLGEEVTRTIAIKADAKGFEENQEAAIKGGQAGGEARERVEIFTGEKVVSGENYLHLGKGENEKDELPHSSLT